MSSDRIDVRYATKESSRHMSSPGELHMNSLGRVGRYLVGRPRLILHYRWQSMPSRLTTYTDSDWAGFPTTAKSTSGGIVCIGGHTVKSYSRQQRTVALSSAEAELHGMVAASAESIGIIGLLRHGDYDSG